MHRCLHIRELISIFTAHLVSESIESADTRGFIFPAGHVLPQCISGWGASIEVFHQSQLALSNL